MPESESNILAAVYIFPPGAVCRTHGCQNLGVPLKKEVARRVVVYTLATGVQPAWEVRLYCASESNIERHTYYHLSKVLIGRQIVTLVTTTTLASIKDSGLIILVFLLTYKLEITNLLSGKLWICGLRKCTKDGTKLLFDICCKLI